MNRGFRHRRGRTGARNCPVGPRLVGRAFTLVELLVVVSIIALLVGLLAPALATARRQARGVQCLGNARQIGLAIHAYAVDSGGVFPIARYFDPARKATVCWDTTTYAGPPRPAAPGLIWQHAPGGRVQQCPSFRGASNTAADAFTGFNYNTSYLGRGEGEPAFAGLGEGPSAVAAVRFPARTALVGDGGYRDGANKFMRAPGDPAGDWVVHAGAQAFRHRGSTNVIRVDGHGGPQTKTFRKAGVRATVEAIMDFPRNAFLSEDDRAYARR